MKKLSVIFLILMYSMSVSGLSLQFRYCCGKLKSVSCKMVPENKCCGTSSCDCQKVASADTQTNSVTLQNLTAKATIPSAFLLNSTYPSGIADEKFREKYSPPLISSSLYLLYSVIKI